MSVRFAARSSDASVGSSTSLASLRGHPTIAGTRTPTHDHRRRHDRARRDDRRRRVRRARPRRAAAAAWGCLSALSDCHCRVRADTTLPDVLVSDVDWPTPWPESAPRGGGFQMVSQRLRVSDGDAESGMRDDAEGLHAGHGAAELDADGSFRVRPEGEAAG